jgi:hypothetical protein
MISNRYRAAMILAPLLACSWLLLAFVDPNGPGNYLSIGFMVGTLFSQPTLAAAWTALGPGPLLWRLPLSLAWIAALAVAYVVQNRLHRISMPSSELVFVASVAGQWMLVQLPLWVLAVVYGLRVRHQSDPPETVRDRQFGIRQVMILTFIVAVVLGVFRLAVAEYAMHFENINRTSLAIIGVQALAAVTMNLPLLIAALLPRFWLPAIGVVLTLIGLGTWYELPLLLIIGGPGVGASVWLLVLINGYQSAWILAVVAILRMCGYGIGRSDRPTVDRG